MKVLRGLVLALAPFATVCAPLNPGVPGGTEITRPLVDGTVFTIVFENANADDVLVPSAKFFYGASRKYGMADAYISNVHPSCPNYILMTSGSKNGVTNDDDPTVAGGILGTENLPDQLDAAKIPWRAYMESMGEPCRTTSTGRYSAHHNPFLYYANVTNDPEKCRNRVVDFDAHFTKDLASNAYRYMWITPNMCSDMHDCPLETADAWLERVVTQIMDSPGYKNGGAIFILFDEGSVRLVKAAADLATIVISPNLASMGYRTSTRFDHRSYLATVEDIFALPRLPTTVDATPMSEFFVAR